MGNRKHLLFHICYLLILTNACREKTKIEETVAHFEISEMPERIEKLLESHRTDTNQNYFDTIASFYGERKFKPYWLLRLEDSMFRVNITLLNDSLIYEGLKRDHYRLDSVISLLDLALRQQPPEIYETLAGAEILFSHFMLSLWHDKVLGRTNPREVLGQKYTLPFPNHPEFRLMDAMDRDSGVKKLISYRPPHPDYKKLRQMLIHAYSQPGGVETMIDTIGIRKLKAGDTSQIIPMLVSRLIELGYAPDSIGLKYSNSNIYTKEISEFVKAFQKAGYLTDDGIIGKSTLKMLNTSHLDRINEIRANIERVKWFGVDPPRPYVRVNIPEFTLYMVYPEDSISSLLVCVGQGKERYYDQKLQKYVVSKRYFDKPMNHETPQIYSKIEWVVLNPTWTVPSSIVGREMYYLIARDPGYLIRNNYQVLKDGKPVNPYSIPWRKYKPGNIPYTIRQNAGDDNSLGKIKFTFKNPFDVYMHDTPLKSKFNRNNRAVSHGCVRVQNPVDLTGFVLQQNEKITYDDVLEMMGLPPTDTARARKWQEDTSSYKKIVTKTRPVRVENPMTVFFDYRTIVFDEADRPRFIFDVYDKNSLIIEALDRP